jgi:hypothetical protein
LPNNENKSKQSNYSMDFDGSSQYISTGFTISSTSSYTLSAWFKTTTTTQDRIFLGDFNSSAQNASARAILGFNGTRIYLNMGDGTNQDNNYGSGYNASSYFDGNWHLYTLTINGFTQKAYLDGTLVETWTSSVSAGAAGERGYTIGRYGDFTSTNYFNGQIDGVSIFNYALTDGTGGTVNQIATLYGSSSTGIGNPMSLSPAPVAYYPLGDQDAFNGADYLVPNSSLKDYVFSFDGSNDYIEVGTGLGNTLGSSVSDMTVSLWYKNQTGSNEGLFTIMSSITAGTTDPFAISYNTNSIYVWFGSNYNYYSQTLDSNWHHLSIVKNGTSLTTYIDGSSVSPTATVGSIPATIDTTNKKTFIGVYYNTSFTYNGSLSNTQVFNTALPATGSNSVETLYNNGSPLTSMSGFTSLQGWWKLDASATYDSSTTTWSIPDDSSNSNTGTSSGMTQSALQQSDLSFKTSISPFALNFDGTDDSINIGTGNILTGVFSVSMWIKRTSTSLGDSAQALFSKDNATSLRSFNNYLDRDTGTLKMWQSANGSSLSVTQSSTAITDTNWHHVVYINAGSGSNCQMYIDGSEVSYSAQQTGVDSIYSSSIDNLLAGHYIATSYQFNGSISNVSIWNAALTSAQVTEIYNEGVPSNLNNHSAYSNLVSWWQLGSNTSWVDPYWISLDEKGTNNGESQNVAAPNNMGENAIVDGVGSYANGLSNSMGGDEVIGDAPYSSSNSLSVNMDVEDRTTDTPS